MKWKRSRKAQQELRQKNQFDTSDISPNIDKPIMATKLNVAAAAGNNAVDKQSSHNNLTTTTGSSGGEMKCKELNSFCGNLTTAAQNKYDVLAPALSQESMTSFLKGDTNLMNPTSKHLFRPYVSFK